MPPQPCLVLVSERHGNHMCVGGGGGLSAAAAAASLLLLLLCVRGRCGDRKDGSPSVASPARLPTDRRRFRTAVSNRHVYQGGITAGCRAFNHSPPSFPLRIAARLSSKGHKPLPSSLLSLTPFFPPFFPRERLLAAAGLLPMPVSNLLLLSSFACMGSLTPTVLSPRCAFFGSAFFFGASHTTEILMRSSHPMWVVYCTVNSPTNRSMTGSPMPRAGTRISTWSLWIHHRTSRFGARCRT